MTHPQEDGCWLGPKINQAMDNACAINGDVRDKTNTPDISPEPERGYGLFVQVFCLTKSVAMYNGLYCDATGLTWARYSGYQTCTPPPDELRPYENLGCPTCKEYLHVAGDPINPGNGNLYEFVADYQSPVSPFLEIKRTYNSLDKVKRAYGFNWVGSYERRLAFPPADDPARMWVRVDRPDGNSKFFFKSGSQFVTYADVSDTLVQLTTSATSSGAWVLSSADGDIAEQYDSDGRFLSMKNRQGQGVTLTYSDSGTSSSVAPGPGYIIAVTDNFGRSIGFTYDGAGRIKGATDPLGGQYVYNYDGLTGCRTPNTSLTPPCATGNLTEVVYPDGKSRLYHYDESTHAAASLPHAMTGQTDENSNRLKTWKFDSTGFAISSEMALGTQKVAISRSTFPYWGGGLSEHVYTVGDPASPVQKNYPYQLTQSGGQTRLYYTLDPATNPDPNWVGLGPCIGCGSVGQYFWDTQGNPTTELQHNLITACNAYDAARNLRTRRVEGLPYQSNCASYLTGTPTLTGTQRMISTTWSTDWRLPAQVAEPLRITTYTYGAPNAGNPGDRGNVLSVSVQATSDATGAAAFSASAVGSPRVTTYTYNANGKVLTINGPRTDVSDVTTYTYYADNDSSPGKRGNVATVSNALGHTTQITSYNAHGQPLSVTSPNGLITAIAYDSRQRMVSRDVGGEVTTYAYDDAGQVTLVTLPDSATLTYTYDTAQRLTAVQDNLGNKIVYTLDLWGNRTKEEILDPASVLAQTRSRVYDALNRLKKEIGAANQTTEYGYDVQGNLTSVTDPRSQVTTNSYDALNRLATMTQPVPTSGAAPVIAYAYNGLDQLTQVTDPRSLVTSYAYDGLGNLNTQVSPDTGTTTNTYDAAGNILTSTDAKSQVTTYTYDAANRVASIVYNQATGTQLKTVTYTYDQGSNGLGRLTTVTESDANAATLQTTQYAYDQRGRLITETRTLAGNTSPYVTGYTYNSTTGRMTGMSYPSGRTLAYSYDALGRISQITTTAPAGQGGQTQTVVSSVTYQPFGGVKTYVRGNNRTVTRTYDQDGRIASYTLGGTSITVGYDTASRITSLLDTTNAANSNSYGYDNLDRLTSASVPGTSYGYAYDLTGNRTSRSAGAATDLTTVSSTSNRISQVAGGSTRTFTYDNNGSTTNDGNNSYSYDPRGRMISATNGAGTTTYQVSSQGQRVRKTGTSGDTVFHYDAQGKLIAETTTAGAVKKEYLYLLDIPVAVNIQQ